MNHSSFDKAIGCFVGLAVGDALGTTLEFKGRRSRDRYHTEMTGGGVFKLPPGYWTDDTSMALALADALLEPRPLAWREKALDNWLAWYRSGQFSSTGECFDIGVGTRKNLELWEIEYENVPASAFRGSGEGNGCITRIAPVPVFAVSNLYARVCGYEQAGLTHSHEAALIAADFSGKLYDLINDGKNRFEDISNIPREEIHSGGYIVDTLEAATWAVATTSNFEDAIIEAVNLGNDADSVGAVAGQIAGALYGYEAIPQRWKDALYDLGTIKKYANDLYAKYHR